MYHLVLLPCYGYNLASVYKFGDEAFLFAPSPNDNWCMNNYLFTIFLPFTMTIPL